MIMLFGCNSGVKPDVDSQLTLSEQDSFKYSIIRYLGHLPKRAKEATKWDSEFDETYLRQAQSFNLDKYHVDKDSGYVYFEISRIAPSFHERYVATGGRLAYNKDGSIGAYEEIYRTWKMSKAQLEEKTRIFFPKMVKGQDLSPYYTANVGDTEHIEFPDEQTYFNKETRKWQHKDAVAEAN